MKNFEINFAEGEEIIYQAKRHNSNESEHIAITDKKLIYFAKSSLFGKIRISRNRSVDSISQSILLDDINSVSVSYNSYKVLGLLLFALGILPILFLQEEVPVLHGTGILVLLIGLFFIAKRPRIWLEVCTSGKSFEFNLYNFTQEETTKVITMIQEHITK